MVGCAEFLNSSDIVSYYGTKIGNRLDFRPSIFDKESEKLKEHYIESNYESYKLSIMINCYNQINGILNNFR
jgi:hypothetical protein